MTIVRAGLALFLVSTWTLGSQSAETKNEAGAVRHSENCAMCHSNAPTARAMRDAEGRAIAPYDLWRSSMMANAARDPLWRAVVSAEVAATPSRRVEIETKCLSCHAPMAHRAGLSDHGTGTLMHVLDCVDERSELARDGVSCTICHGIRAEGLGTQASFSAGFHLDGERMFGPHAQPFPMPMSRMSGFTPTQGGQILDSALCASCHTLETHPFDAEGEDQGHVFLEQAPYLEWRNSVFDTERKSPGPRAANCQDCHAPQFGADGERTSTPIARNPMGRDFPAVRPRQPFGRHLFVGGNTLVLSMLRDFGPDLGAQASPEAFEATLRATRDQLENRSASLAIAEVNESESGVTVEVLVNNRAGHKLPTGHPVRRAWLHLTVRGASGERLFESGAYDGEGRLVDMKGEPLASEFAGGPIEPHRDVVRRGNEVATFEAVMADANGEPTHLLMRGASWYVDDRLLPAGWSAEHPDAERTAPAGFTDENFVGGSDRVRFDLAVPFADVGEVEAELLYQPLSARWAAELAEWETDDITKFFDLYERSERAPEVMARVHWDRR